MIPLLIVFGHREPHNAVFLHVPVQEEFALLGLRRATSGRQRSTIADLIQTCVGMNHSRFAIILDY